MPDAAVGDVGDVQQSVDAAQVDERAVFGEVLHHAVHQVALVMCSSSVDLRAPMSSSSASLARHDDVVAPPVQLDDFDFDILADEGVQVVDLARRRPACWA
jgi:hypothetical protein